MVRKTILIFLVGALAAGCTADFYRQSADAQVDHIVRERESQTLHYTPDVDTRSEVNPKPAPMAYSKIPATPKPPPTTSPIEPSELKLPYGKLGPEQLFPDGVSAPQSNYGLDVARLREGSKLVLGPPAPGQAVMRLDLFGSIRYAVVHSRDYKSKMEDLYLAALEVTLQRHLFEPRPFASTGLKYTGGQEAVGYAAALTAFNTLGVSQKLPYGGQIAAQSTVDFVRAISGSARDGESATATLTASIPLLRNAGMVNLEPLISSEREMVYAVRTFELYRRDFAVNVATQYFGLLREQQRVANRVSNLLSYQALTQRTQALSAAGRLSYIDVQRSLQNQLSAEQSLVDEQVTYRTAVDSFKLLLGMSVDQPLEVIAQELAVQPPHLEQKSAVDMALKFRLDLKTSQDQVEDAQRKVQVQQNQLLPDLNVTAQAGVGNPPDEPASNLNNNQTNYSASVELDLPLDRLAERNAYRQALISLERSERSYDQMRDQVTADVRQSLRTFQSAQTSLDIQRKGIELAKLTLENANELLRQGKEDSRDVTDAQTALLGAQDDYEAANASLQIQVLSFLRDTGLLRVDPDAGAIGQALDRKADSVNEPPLPR